MHNKNVSHVEEDSGSGLCLYVSLEHSRSMSNKIGVFLYNVLVGKLHHSRSISNKIQVIWFAMSYHPAGSGFHPKAVARHLCFRRLLIARAAFGNKSLCLSSDVQRFELHSCRAGAAPCELMRQLLSFNENPTAELLLCRPVHNRGWPMVDGLKHIRTSVARRMLLRVRKAGFPHLMVNRASETENIKYAEDSQD